MTKEQYLIYELAKQAGVSIRTIRYYIEQGLLPSPSLRGRYSLYDEEFLHRINLLKVLQEAHLPLREIRQQIEILSPQEIKELLEKHEKEISRFRESPNLLPEPTTIHESKENIHSAKEYIDRILGAYTPTVNQKIHNIQQGEVIQPSPSRLEKAVQPPLPVTQEQVSEWRRMILAPGVELHWSHPPETQADEQIQNLIQLAK